MRILHVSSLYPPHIVGGCERSVEHLAEELVEMGHEVGAACIEREAQAPETRNGVDVHRVAHNNDFWLEDWPEYGRSQRRMQKLRQQWNLKQAADFDRVFETFQPDIINTHSLLDVTTLIWGKAARRGIPVVHTICEYDLICGNAAMFKDGEPCAKIHTGCRVVNFSKAINQKHIAAVASVGTEILNVHMRHGYFHHIPEELRRVIFYSCTVPGGDPVERRKIDRSGKPLTFGYIGRINTEKGVGTMVDAFRQVGVGNWRCMVAGQAMDDSIERFTAASEGLPIDFIGWATPKTFFEEIDVLIVPSFWAEPSPRTIYEAYAMGVPVIGAASGGIPELIGDDNHDWLFTPGNADELADRIRRVLSLGRESLPTEADFGDIVERSTARQVGENYLKLYEDVLAK